ncbi:MAG TPA: hypothetical protein VK155_14835 [Bacteroidales bacterium]|nr:hypothetical protein [Bacteroidales bacterium]
MSRFLQHPAPNQETASSRYLDARICHPANPAPGVTTGFVYVCTAILHQVASTMFIVTD